MHVYRRAANDTLAMHQKLARCGKAITYDNDDDFTSVPAESPDYRKVGGHKGQRIFGLTVKAARLARTFTTTSDTLAAKYRRAGVERIEVIANHLAAETARPRRRHDGIVVGWVAGVDHRADVARIDVVGALRRLLEMHDHVRVECIGVNLALPERFRHDAFVPFGELPARIGGFDIGIAPLAHIPGRERRRFARKAKRWASRQTIDAVADRWEQLFAELAR